MNLEALPPWQPLETHNPSGQAFPYETRAGFHSFSFLPSLTLSLPPLVCRIAARKVQKVKALLSSFLCHPLKWNVEEEGDRRETGGIQRERGRGVHRFACTELLEICALPLYSSLTAFTPPHTTTQIYI